jgi:hypothetical protein
METKVPPGTPRRCNGTNEKEEKKLFQIINPLRKAPNRRLGLSENNFH